MESESPYWQFSMAHDSLISGLKCSKLIFMHRQLTIGFGLNLLKGNFLSNQPGICQREVGEEFEFHSTIWFPSHYPEMATCLLRALLGKLLIKDKLLNFGIIQSNICTLWNSCPETINHLFFDCSYSRYIWCLCRLKFGLQQGINSLEEARLIKNKFKTKCRTAALASL